MLASAVSANDGAYLTSGSNIYPVLETDISMDKEFLSFKVIDGIAHVSIEFDFLNNSDQKKNIQVGFQAPSSSGDVSEELTSHSQIRDFKVQINESVMPYTLYAANCEDCELMDVSKASFSQSMGGVFVYLFDATFNLGINKVNHSYSFPASGNVTVDEIYDYILTTGAKWASGTIREFELNIDMGPNSYFYVSDIYGEKANWSI